MDPHKIYLVILFQMDDVPMNHLTFDKIVPLDKINVDQECEMAEFASALSLKDSMSSAPVEKNDVEEVASSYVEDSTSASLMEASSSSAAQAGSSKELDGKQTPSPAQAGSSKQLDGKQTPSPARIVNVSEGGQSSNSRRVPVESFSVRVL